MATGLIHAARLAPRSALRGDHPRPARHADAQRSHRPPPPAAPHRGPGTTVKVKSTLGIEPSQQRAAAAMRPKPGDKNVATEEIVAYLDKVGVQSRVMVGGDTQRLRQLLAAGIPVIVEQLLH